MYDNIRDMIGRLDGLLRETTELTKELGVQLEVDCFPDNDDPEKASGCVVAGDYERYLYPDGTCWWNYRPKIIKNGEYDFTAYQDHLDIERIQSFTMPPLPKKKE